VTGAGVIRVACVQLNTRADRSANVLAAAALVEEAAAAGAQIVALPETWAYKGPGEGIHATAEPPGGPSNAALAEVTARHGAWLLAGSVYEPSPVPGRVYNTSALFGPDGALRAVYRKIHLFDAVSGTVAYRESDDLLAGTEVVTASVEPAAPERTRVTVGLSICYDLRFPELYRALALGGAQILFVPAAFTAHTGEAHWELLLRARAVENGCFVVAPNQVGEHLPGRECFGNSMVVDPWGTVVARVESGVGICVADLDLGRVAEVRAQLPSLANRRPEAYGV
jgi:predicted amidohydrolase